MPSEERERGREWWEEPPPNELEGLPRHIVRKLVAANITSAQQIADAGEKNLLSIDGIGWRAIEEIKHWLREQFRQDGH